MSHKVYTLVQFWKLPDAITGHVDLSDVEDTQSILWAHKNPLVGEGFL
jgi:hypothetical protein